MLKDVFGILEGIADSATNLQAGVQPQAIQSRDPKSITSRIEAARERLEESAEKQETPSAPVARDAMMAVVLDYGGTAGAGETKTVNVSGYGFRIARQYSSASGRDASVATYPFTVTVYSLESQVGYTIYVYSDEWVSIPSGFQKLQIQASGGSVDNTSPMVANATERYLLSVATRPGFSIIPGSQRNENYPATMGGSGEVYYYLSALQTAGAAATNPPPNATSGFALDNVAAAIFKLYADTAGQTITGGSARLWLYDPIQSRWTLTKTATVPTGARDVDAFGAAVEFKVRHSTMRAYLEAFNVTTSGGDIKAEAVLIRN